MDRQKLQELLEATQAVEAEVDPRFIRVGQALGESTLAWLEYIGDTYSNAGFERILTSTDAEMKEHLDQKGQVFEKELARIRNKYAPE